MSTICWTILHRGTVPVRHAIRRAHPVHHLIHRAPRHAATVAKHVGAWTEIVCKTIAPALLGGGMLLPRPAANLPRPPDPPALVQPARPSIPPISPAFPPDWSPSPWSPTIPEIGSSKVQ